MLGLVPIGVTDAQIQFFFTRRLYAFDGLPEPRIGAIKIKQAGNQSQRRVIVLGGGAVSRWFPLLLQKHVGLPQRQLPLAISDTNPPDGPVAHVTDGVDTGQRFAICSQCFQVGIGFDSATLGQRNSCRHPFGIRHAAKEFTNRLDRQTLAFGGFHELWIAVLITKQPGDGIALDDRDLRMTSQRINLILTHAADGTTGSVGNR